VKYPDRNTGEPDAEPLRCVHVDAGIRCAKPGSLSMSTLNHGLSGKENPSPFFCAQHFPIFIERNRAIVASSDTPNLRYDGIAALPAEQKKPDNKDWARRILHRKEAGERVPQLSVAFAREALGLSIDRQPGEDG
jgi:hypothetical protein